MSHKKLLFVVNPKAGKTTIKNDLFSIIETFSNAGYRVEVYPTKGPGDAKEHIAKVGKKYDLIVCAGGDGTLDNSVAGLMELEKGKKPRSSGLGYIPCGSTNDFARSLMISRQPLRAAEQVVAGDPCPIDVGMLGDNYFIYVAAFGAFTDVSYSTPQNLKNSLGHVAYVIEAIKNLTNLKSYNLKADFDGRQFTGEFIYGQITNSLSVGGFKTIGVQHMSFSDGVFECVLIKKPETPAQLQKIVNALLTDKLDDSNIIYEKAANITITCDEPVKWTLDGEYGGEYTVSKVKNLKRAVPIILDDKTNYIGDEDVVLEKIDKEVVEGIRRNNTEVLTTEGNE